MLPNPLYLVAGLCLLLQGCATYPLPQDYTGFDTHKIVTNIRCEARSAVQDALIFALSRYDDQVIFISHDKRRLTGVEAAFELKNDRTQIQKIDLRNDIIGAAKDPFRYYKNSQIAYDFSLKAAEMNTQGIDFGLVRQFGRRSDSLGFGGTATRTRDVTRGFFIWDTFEALLKAPDRFCEAGKSINILYPATGRLEIYDLVQSYIYENDQGALIISKPNKLVDSGTGPTVPQMADTINFVTKLNGNMTPRIDLNPVGMGLQLASIGITNNNQREDTHKVVVAISTAEVDVPARFRPGSRTPPSLPTRSRLELAQESIVIQNNRRIRDAIIDIGNNIERLPF